MSIFLPHRHFVNSALTLLMAVATFVFRTPAFGQDTNPPSTPPPGDCVTPAPNFGGIERVVLIGVDGLGSYICPSGDQHGTDFIPPEPHIPVTMPRLWTRLKMPPDGTEASWSFRMRTRNVVVSGTNWAALLSGAGPIKTGLRTRDDANKIAEAGRRRVPNIFQVFKTQRPEKRVFGASSWSGIVGLLDKKGGFRRSGAMEASSSDTFDVYFDFAEGHAEQRTSLQKWDDSKVDDRAVLDQVMMELRRPEPAALIWSYFLQVDKAGHAKGWDSTEQKDSIARVDSYIDGILTTIAANPTLRASTLVFIVSDHGGRGSNHGRDGDWRCEQLVPLVVFGPKDVVSQGELMLEEVANLDVPMTIAAALGLGVPDDWEGEVRTELFDRSPPNPSRYKTRIGAALTGIPAVPNKIERWKKDLPKFVKKNHLSLLDRCVGRRTYFFTGSSYTRFDLSIAELTFDPTRLPKALTDFCALVTATGALRGTAEDGYPRRASGARDWGKLADHVDATFAYKRPKLGLCYYFFEDKKYSRFCVDARDKDKIDQSIAESWKGLDGPLDAALEEDPESNLVHFFSHQSVRTYDMSKDKVVRTTDLRHVFPGFPSEVNVDAATSQRVGHDHYAYLFARNLFWIYKREKPGRYALHEGPKAVTSGDDGTWPGLMLRTYE